MMACSVECIAGGGGIAHLVCIRIHLPVCYACITKLIRLRRWACATPSLGCRFLETVRTCASAYIVFTRAFLVYRLLRIESSLSINLNVPLLLFIVLDQLFIINSLAELFRLFICCIPTLRHKLYRQCWEDLSLKRNLVCRCSPWTDSWSLSLHDFGGAASLFCSFQPWTNRKGASAR